MLIKSDPMTSDQVRQLEGVLNDGQRAAAASKAGKAIRVVSQIPITSKDGTEQFLVDLMVENLYQPVCTATLLKALEVMGVHGIIRITDKPVEVS